MISDVLTFAKGQLDQYLSLRFGLDEPAVVINSLPGLNGQTMLGNQNRVVISLVNLEHEESLRNFPAQRVTNDGLGVSSNRPQSFNINLLLTANFDDYQEALKFLDETISFFQTNSSFSTNSNPELPAVLTSLNFNVENIDLLDTHKLNPGGQPCILYKVRQIVFDGDTENGAQPVRTNVVSEADG